jgi:hypothetical protein
MSAIYRGPIEAYGEPQTPVSRGPFVDETLKTIRAVYLAFLTLCFVSSVFLGSIRQPPYAEIAASLRELLDARAYLFPTKEINQALVAVEEPATDLPRFFGPPLA